MHRGILSAIVASLTLNAGALMAAPTCLNGAGATIRCGATGAMPLGWAPSPEQLSDRRDQGPTEVEALGIVYVVGAVFALIALMPPFDGRKDSDWDEQEGDVDRRR